MYTYCYFYFKIYVGGPTLARGYLNLPEVNKKRFIQLEINGVMQRAYRFQNFIV